MTAPQQPPADDTIEVGSPGSPVESGGHPTVPANEQVKERTRQPRARLRPNLPWVGAKIPIWLPLLLAVISFITSTYTFLATNAAPDLALTMPAFVRVAQGPNLGGVAVVYVQPSFTNAGQSARVEVISGMTLRVQPVSGGDAVTFTWQEIDRFVAATTTPGVFSLNYEYEGDAQPLLVSQGNPQAPVANFNGPPGWYFAPGSYKMTLIAARQVNTAPLQRTIEVKLSADNIAALDRKGGGAFVKVDARIIQ